MEKFNKIVCFGKDVKVSTRNGEKSIKQVKPGNKVISYDHNLGIAEEIVVVRTANSKHSVMNKITFANSISIESTIDHPFWVVGKGWCSVNPTSTNENYNLQVGEISVGDACIYFDKGNFVEMKIIKIDTINGEFRMYTISGGKNHCFFANGFLVHDENLQNLELTANSVESARPFGGF